MTKIEALVDGIEYDFDKLNQLIGSKFDKSTKLATPAEVAKTKRGICHESAIFMAKKIGEKKVRYLIWQ